MTDQKTQLQSIGRVVAGVVDVQQTMALQFDALSKGLEALKLEHQSGIAQLREDIRRSDDRATKQFADLNALHNKEMERLHQIIHTMLLRDTAQQQQIPMQQQQQQQLQQALFMQRQMEMAAQAQAQAQAQAMANLMNAGGAKPLLPTPTQQIKPQLPMGATPVTIAPKPTSEVTIPPAAVPTAVKPLFPAQTVAPVVPAAPEKPKTTTTTPAAAPTFSFGSGATSIFGKKPDAPAVVAQPPVLIPAAKTQEKEDDEEGNDEDYEPQATFEPVIPLPDLVEVKTGEEDEEVVFNNRSKLYIYTNDEWKERGTGELKVLLNKETSKYRVVMRRDQVTISEEPLARDPEELCWNVQVLKVCANFPIVGSMSIQQHAKNERAYTWFCEDFSEEEENDHKGTLVNLSARFATVDIAVEFKNLFEKAVKAAGSIDKEIGKSVEVKKEVKKEIKEEVVIPSNNKENGFGDKFKPKAGSWECSGCYVTCGAEETVCACCGANKDGSVGEKNIFSKPSILQPAPGTPKVTFGFSASATTAKASPVTTSATAFGASLSGSPSTTANTSIFGGGTPKTGAAATPSFSFNTGAKPAGTGTPAAPSFNFNKTASPAPSAGNALFGGGVKTSDATPSFSFITKPSEATVPKPLFSFAPKPAASAAPDTEKSSESTAPKSVFGSSFTSGNESFASLAAKANTSSTSSSIFDADRVQKAQAELASQKKASIFGSKTSTPTQNNEEAEGAEGEYEPEVEFKPVCPLPDLVEVRTGEEDETVVFTARCKLFKYHADIKENKERGVGDIKVLKSADNKYRVVMRREQVHKLCANFRIEKTMRLEPKANLPQVLTFMCQDYSEDPSNADACIFTVKFKEESIAAGFRKAVEEAQASM